jgi:outer membrane protein OmpA-like peptidoglycan-associated protein
MSFPLRPDSRRCRPSCYRAAIIGLVGMSVLVLMNACARNNPTTAEPTQTGQEKTVSPTSSLPLAGTGRQYDATAAPVDEARSIPRIGSIVTESGGQKAQKMKERQEAAEIEAKERDTGDEARSEETARKITDPSAGREPKAPAQGTDPATQATAPASPGPATSGDVPPSAPESSDAPPAASPPLSSPTTSPSSQFAPAPIPAPASLPAPDATIRFDADSPEIGASAKAELDRIAKRANERGVQQIELRAYAAGGTDVVESRNTALARLLAVRSYLIDAGVRAQIEVHTFGAVPGDKNTLQRIDLVVPGV